MPASDFTDIEPGDYVTMPEEDISGEITDVFDDEFGHPASCVVKNYDGYWISLDFSLLTIVNGKLN